MSTSRPLKLLLVEDNIDDLNLCRTALTVYHEKTKHDIRLVEARNVHEALQLLDNSFDGAIIDLKLAQNGNEGEQVLDKIRTSEFRIPTVIFTATPTPLESDGFLIDVYKKGQTGYAELLEILWGLYNTGLTRIIGGRGEIERTLSRVFTKNILPQRQQWVAHGSSNASRTEKALLRHTLNHLLELLDDEVKDCFPEEMYISPPIVSTPRTGSIVQQKNGDKACVVLNPACDLVIRSNGKFKTDRLLLGEIESQEAVVSEVRGIQMSRAQKEKKKAEACDHHNPNAESYKALLKHLDEGVQRAIAALFHNNHTPYYHWLPKHGSFPGGFLNFRRLVTMTKEQFDQDYHPAKLQIAASFAKDIVARFASYNGRQGQPDIDCTALIAEFSAEKNQVLQ